MPVYGNNSGEPCHGSTFADSWCQQAHKWNLDYVVDVHGNVVTYWYEKERNHYGRNAQTAPTPYDRGGYLKRIDYGLRSDDVYATAPARVSFTVSERCIPTDTFNCAPSKLTPTNASHWPDVPFDQNCDAGTQCTGQFSPTFWTRKKLDKITTQIHNGTSYTDVDSWTLEHAFPAPGDGTTPSLWLKSITHTGHVGGTVTMPKVTFEGTALENRVDGLADGLAPMLKYRITSIYTESGGQIDVSYSAPECTRGSTPQPHANTKRCYPVRWTPEGEPEMVDWFHKYVVTQIAEFDLVADQPEVVTTYEYLGGAAWRYVEANGLIKDKYRTWSDWRGYERVRMRTGHPDGVRSETEYLYFRGMHGDKQPSGTRSVTVTDSTGGTHTDHNELAGTLREEILRNGVDGEVVTRTITDPWRKKTAENVHPWATVRAYMLGVSATHTYTSLGGGQWLQTRVENTMDDHGAVVEVNDLGDVTDPADDECVRTDYVRNTGIWLMNLISRSETVNVNCDTTPSRPDNVISDERIHYDGLAFGATPVKGSPTKTEKIDSYDNGQPVYQRVDLTTFDAYGREHTVTDPAGNTTTTTHTHNAAGLLVSTAETNPLGHVSTTEFDPARGLPVAEIDPNGRRIDLAYDPLGRLTSVWLPDRNKATTTPTATFEYLVHKDQPTVIVSNTIRNDGQYTTTYEIFDGLMRPRQTQGPAVGGGRLITDTFHDSRGLVVKEREPYFNNNDPSGTLLVVNNDDDIPRQTETVYDGAERPTDVLHVSRGEEQWRTTTEYRGDRTLITPPEGGIATTTIVDARGRTVELREHHGPTPDSAYDALTYTYAKHGGVATVTDVEGNVWETVYDLRGRKVASTDPDTGTTTYTYNDLDQLVSTTDARGETLAYTYDALGRKTGLFDDSPQGTQRAAWIYDTKAKGYLTSSTRYIDGHAYTTEVLAYDQMNRVVASTVKIPAVEGVLAGTYRYGYRYNADGTLRSVDYPAGGTLGRETVIYSYNELGMPVRVEGFGDDVYVDETVYSRTGNLLRRTFDLGGSGSDVTWATRGYDLATDRLVSSSVVHQVGSGSLLEQSYTYDDAGNVLSISDAPTAYGLPGDTQCFAYDHLRRLTEVWTPDTHGTTACDAAPDVDDLGGASPYWHSYTYDAVGNRETEVRHSASGDTVRTYTTPTAGQSQPHTLTQVEQTGPTGTRLEQYTYDASGNMTGRTTASRDQDLEWDAEGRLVEVTEEDGSTTSFRYDADGQRLIRDTPTEAVLYLAGMEVRLDKTVPSVEATRFYEHAGETVAVRTGDGSVHWTFSDHQATGQLAVHALTGQTVRRRTTAFGTDRGSTGTWPTDKGFVSGTVDESTGLVQLGARAYDANIGRFISADPIIDFVDSQQMHGYAYANNSPITFSDSDGLMVKGPGKKQVSASTGGRRIRHNLRGAARKAAHQAYNRYHGISTGTPRGGGSSAVPSSSSSSHDEAREELAAAATGLAKIVADELGISAGIECLTTGDIGACGETALNVAMALFAPGGVLAKLAVKYALRWGKFASLVSKVKKLGGEIISAVNTLMKKDSGNAVSAAACPVRGPNSFVSGTRVLMADGTSKPIEKVKTGDQVLATDPETGEQGPRTVLATIVGTGAKTLVEITVDATTEKPADDDSDREGTPGPTAAGDVILATDEHPFWVPELGQWVDAIDLTPGMWLQTSAGTWVQITAIQAWTQAATVHNLTVQDQHTYYALAGATPVLNHNCSWTSQANLDNHYRKHGEEMGFETQIEYQSAAEDLMCDCDGLRSGVRTRTVDGTTYYLDEESGEFGVKSERGIVTYYNAGENAVSYFERQGGFEVGR
ncbi:RHS repeat-associated protein [Thermobifida halotolerans]|uniref:RHS repeat-associated core domain-containing protein n=1 Tax=Thermobifida halotolerans TaxID=483545 RepID=UPI0035170D94